jgi:hypothetical protein
MAPQGNSYAAGCRVVGAVSNAHIVPCQSGFRAYGVEPAPYCFRLPVARRVPSPERLGLAGLPSAAGVYSRALCHPLHATFDCTHHSSQVHLAYARQAGAAASS